MKNVNSKDAYDLLMLSEKSHLIDVRTPEEWRFVGVPNLTFANHRLHFVSWRYLPEMSKNDKFVQSIRDKIPNYKCDLFLICRSGGRSLEAGMELLGLGYESCYNVENGFEGDLDENNHRGVINGWQYLGLPWKQS